MLRTVLGILVWWCFVHRKSVYLYFPLRLMSLSMRRVSVVRKLFLESAGYGSVGGFPHSHLYSYSVCVVFKDEKEIFQIFETIWQCIFCSKIPRFNLWHGIKKGSSGKLNSEASLRLQSRQKATLNRYYVFTHGKRDHPSVPIDISQVHLTHSSHSGTRPNRGLTFDWRTRE